MSEQTELNPEIDTRNMGVSKDSCKHII